ncbi:hypothetical protein Pcinc_004094 [Petrolisthes cinctipes]|uniref:Uncharacterized protein n=1 Tax=Petrolisthes cinctipes TaxID=88211 RepID=A0AAE1GHY4_PETCI|nr:hypothetical protein Pcinc_004094 [Petrolisthes cinctipes]
MTSIPGMADKLLRGVTSKTCSDQKADSNREVEVITISQAATSNSSSSSDNKKSCDQLPQISISPVMADKPMRGITTERKAVNDRDVEIITISQSAPSKSSSSSVNEKLSHQQPQIPSSPECQAKGDVSNSQGLQQKASCTLGKDELLKKCPGKGGTKISWRPGSGRHVSEGPDSYRLFSRISRTLHMEDAVDVCLKWRMEPKNIISFSCIDSRDLPPIHPCHDLKVLWFGAHFHCNQDEDEPDWYGNVQFSVDSAILLDNWKFFFLVEMMTTPTHTCSRILVTNTDYSDVLPPYDYRRSGGPWQVTSQGHQALVNCSRFRFKGTNSHQHILEFMIDVSQEDEKDLRNHEDAQNMKVRHVCNRYQRAGTPCPTPFSCSVTASLFFHKLEKLGVCLTAGIPNLSESGKNHLLQYLQDKKQI